MTLKSNIYLSYALSFFFHSWFWLGVWLLYYLQFMDYAQVGLLESVMIITATTFEIPTGALADMIGKKWTLFLTFLVGGIGNIILGAAGSVSILAVGVFVATLSDPLYSGSLEALVYDSLKEIKKEHNFDKVISNINSIGFIGSALASIIGGFLFEINHSLPFYMVSLFYFIAMVVVLFLQEPSIDSEVFSWDNYVEQTKNGFRQLFKTKAIKKQSLLMLGTGFFSMIAYHVLIDAVSVEYGFSGKQLGLLFAGTFGVGIIVSQFTAKILSKVSELKTIFVVSLLMSLGFVGMGMTYWYWGAMTVLTFAGLNTIYKNVSSVLVNKNTISKYRATTISTLSMLKNIPYVLSAFFIGSLMDVYSAKAFSIWMGVMLVMVVVGWRAYASSKSKV